MGEGMVSLCRSDIQEECADIGGARRARGRKTIARGALEWHASQRGDLPGQVQRP
jgi:hypothetical protein